MKYGANSLMRGHLWRKEGSITVEALIVVSAVLFVLIAVIISFLFMYQKVLLSQAAALAAQQGAEVWVDSRKVVENGAWDDSESKDALYHHLLDFNKTFSETLDMNTDFDKKYDEAKKSKNGSTQNRKMSEIRKAIYSKLSKGISKPENTKITVNYRNIVVQGKIEVILEQEIKLPFGGVKKFFTGKDTVTLSSRGVAVVAEPAEYIRNMDLILEYLNRAEGKIDLGGKIKDLKDKVLGK